MTQPTDPARSAQLEVAVTVDADTAAIRAIGVLDASGGEQLRAAIVRLPELLRCVELDLSGVTSADLGGVRALSEVRRTILDTGADLMISNADVAAYPTDWRVVSRTNEPHAEQRPGTS